MHSESPKYDAFAARAPPQTLMGEFRVILPDPLAGFGESE